MLTEISQESLVEGNEYLIINRKLREVFRAVLVKNNDIISYLDYEPLEIIIDERGYITRAIEKENKKIMGSQFDRFYVGEFNKEELVAEVL